MRHDRHHVTFLHCLDGIRDVQFVLHVPPGVDLTRALRDFKRARGIKRCPLAKLYLKKQTTFALNKWTTTIIGS